MDETEGVTRIVIQLFHPESKRSLSRIAEAVLYFDAAFLEIVHRGHDRDEWSQSLKSPEARSAGPVVRCVEEVGPNTLVSKFHRLKISGPWRPLPDHVGTTRPPPPPDFDQYFRQENTGYCWDFRQAKGGHSDFPKLIFRGAPPCITAREALAWSELAMSFIHAAISTSTDKLSRFATDPDGLWAFLEQTFVPGFNEPERMAPIWEMMRMRRRGVVKHVVTGERERGTPEPHPARPARKKVVDPAAARREAAAARRAAAAAASSPSPSPSPAAGGGLFRLNTPWE
jgi:hypothetical protein